MRFAECALPERWLGTEFEVVVPEGVKVVLHGGDKKDGLALLRTGLYKGVPGARMLSVARLT